MTDGPGRSHNGHGDDDDLVWFFAYGSLMWNTGFEVDAFEPARLDGYHRSLCITSRHYRGTPEQPGLVLGLDLGGMCVGRALGARRDREAEVLAYLDDREQVGGMYVYDRRKLPLRLLASDRLVHAWCYVAAREHGDYAASLDRPSVIARVRSAAGRTGTNLDYVRNTIEHLRALGIAEPELSDVLAAAEHSP